MLRNSNSVQEIKPLGNVKLSERGSVDNETPTQVNYNYWKYNGLTDKHKQYLNNIASLIDLHKQGALKTIESLKNYDNASANLVNIIKSGNSAKKLHNDINYM